MEQVLTEDVSGQESGREVRKHVAVVEAEDLPPNARELTPEQRDHLDCTLQTLFARYAHPDAMKILEHQHLGYAEKAVELFGLYLWTWYPTAKEVHKTLQQLMPPYMQVYLQRRMHHLLMDRVTSA